MNSSQTYLVGGAVRDGLLGLTVKERDYVVVGSSAEALLTLGYQQVGKDFPVFLHPKSKEEYALARTERKAGQGYKGFQVHATPEVTLEDPPHFHNPLTTDPCTFYLVRFLSFSVLFLVAEETSTRHPRKELVEKNAETSIDC